MSTMSVATLYVRSYAGYFLEASAKAGIEVIVLGPPKSDHWLLRARRHPDPGHESFVNYFPVPVRHGMTMGELAKMFNTERKYQCATDGHPHGWMDARRLVRLPLAFPGSILRQHAQPYRSDLYPGVGLVEGTNVSVGRGNRHSL